MVDMETFPGSEKARKLENIRRKILGKDDPRVILLSLFEELGEDYDLVEKEINMLKGGKLTDDVRERLHAVDDVYDGALDEWTTSYEK